MSFSTIIINGVMDDFHQKNSHYRYVKCAKITPLSDLQEEILVPILYWNYLNGDSLKRIKKGTKVLLRGRFDSSKEFPVYVLVEKIEFL